MYYIKLSYNKTIYTQRKYKYFIIYYNIIKLNKLTIKTEVFRILRGKLGERRDVFHTST